MSLWGWLTNPFGKIIHSNQKQKSKPKQDKGVIFLKPSEKKQAKKITKSTGIKTIIPTSKNTYTSYTKTSSGSVHKSINNSFKSSGGGRSIQKVLNKKPNPTVSIGKKVTSLPTKSQLSIQKSTGLTKSQLNRSRLITRNKRTFIETNPLSHTYFTKQIGEIDGAPINKYYKIESSKLKNKPILSNPLTLKGIKEVKGDELHKLLASENVLRAVTNKEIKLKLNNLRRKAYTITGQMKDPFAAVEYDRLLAQEIDRHNMKKKNFLPKAASKALKIHAMFVGELAENVVGLPLGIISLIENPKNILKIPKNMAEDAKSTIQLISTKPGEGIAKIGADYLSFKIADEGLKLTGKLSSKVKTRLNPYFKKFKEDVVIIEKPPKEVFIRKGKQVYLKKRVLKTSTLNKLKSFIKKNIKNEDIKKLIKVRKAGQFKKFQKGEGLKLKKGLLTDVSKPLSKQVKMAGKTRTLVTSQADRLVSLFKSNKIVRKPLPGEEGLSKVTKDLLKKYDSGKITKAEFKKLNERVLKETGKTMLERSVYADLDKLIRFTRLGGEGTEATLKDYLSGDVTFKKQKPQILVFKNEKLAKFPKQLKSIIKKLENGKKITEKERAKLTEWASHSKNQFTKWKLPGDVRYRGGIESETTLQAGNIIKRVKKLAQVEIDGTPVEIVEAKVVRLKKGTKDLIKKAEKGILKEKEISKLQEAIKKDTKLKISKKAIKEMNKRVSRDYLRKTGKKYIPIKRYALEKILKASRKRKLKSKRKIISRPVIKRRTITKKTIKRTPTKRVLKRTPVKRTAPRKIIKRKPVKRTTTKRVIKRTTVKRTPIKRVVRRTTLKRTAPRRTVRRNVNTPKIIKTPRLPKGRTSIQRKKTFKKVTGYNVYVKQRGKYIKVNTKPLPKIMALNRGSYIINHSTSATMKIIPTKKVSKTGSITKKEIGQFNKVKKNLRNYRIIKGKKKKISGLYIERKGKPRINTVGEKKRLTALALAKRLGVKNTKKTKIKKKNVVKRNLRNYRIIKGKKKKVSLTNRKSESLRLQRLKSLAKARKILALKRSLKLR